MKSPVRRILPPAILGGLWWASRRWWRRRTAPGSPITPATPWPPVPRPASPGEAGVAGGAGVAGVAGAPSRPGAAARKGEAVGRLAAQPVDGGCPEGYPVKAKQRSRIYHLPGMAAYQRTRPDCCYRCAEDAEEEGFRPAKR